MIRQENIALAVAALVITLVGVSGSSAQTIDAKKAAKVKSAYLLNFAKFTTWPDGSFANDDSPFVLCVWGHDTLGKSLEQMADGKSIGGRKVVISRIESIADNAAMKAKTDAPDTTQGLDEDVLAILNKCHLLYIADTEAKHLPGILRATERLTVLTVSDIPRFAQQGGMIGLVLRKGKITFDANSNVIKNAGVQVSSKILRLATIVQTEGDL